LDLPFALPLTLFRTLNWLPWPLVPKRQWLAARFKEKRVITLGKHQKILAAEDWKNTKGQRPRRPKRRCECREPKSRIILSRIHGLHPGECFSVRMTTARDHK
jgi:hypothetical protein